MEIPYEDSITFRFVFDEFPAPYDSARSVCACLQIVMTYGSGCRPAKYRAQSWVTNGQRSTADVRLDIGVFFLFLSTPCGFRSLMKMTRVDATLRHAVAEYVGHIFSTSRFFIQPIKAHFSTSRAEQTEDPFGRS